MSKKEPKRRQKQSRSLRVAAPGADSARAAGLHYATDTSEGIRRVRCGRGFMYRNANGRIVRDRATLARIRALVLPPAWRDVRVAPDPLPICRRQGSTPRAVSNIGITDPGRPSATPPNITACSHLRGRCPRFADEPRVTGADRRCRGRACWRRSFDCWSVRTFASGRRNTRARTALTVSRRCETGM